MRMEAWREPRSLFAPLIVGADLSAESAPTFGNALLAAAASIPAVMVPYEVKRPGKFKRSEETRPRTLVSITGKPALPYQVRIRLVDIPPGMAAVAAPLACRIWEVGMRVLGKGMAGPAVTAGLNVGFMELAMYQLSQGGLGGGAQLALLRHLWALTLRAADPDLVVVGGQDAWSDSWWCEMQSKT